MTEYFLMDKRTNYIISGIHDRKDTINIDFCIQYENNHGLGLIGMTLKRSDCVIVRTTYGKRVSCNDFTQNPRRSERCAVAGWWKVTLDIIDEIYELEA